MSCAWSRARSWPKGRPPQCKRTRKCSKPTWAIEEHAIMAEKIIEFEQVVAGYSPSLTILNQTTLDARKGEISLLIGPNGAGKSTVLKTLFGLLTPRSGEVRFEGKRINGKTQRQLLAEGIAFVPQGRNLFGSLSVRHNLELGGITLPRGELNGRIEEVLTRFPRIKERINNQASTMS